MEDPEGKIDKVSFYYKSGEEQKNIFYGRNEDYYLLEKNGYKSNDFKELIKVECYLKIKYNDDTEEIIPVKFKIDYINDNVFPEKIESNANDDIVTNEDLIKKLEKIGFEFSRNQYFQNLSDNVTCKFYLRMNKIEISINSDSVFEFLYSFLDNSKIFYERTEGDNETITKTIEEKGKINCNVEKCTTIEDFAKYINYLKYE